LSAEFFHRAGFSVELGKGRNDDGIDVRAWKAGADVGGPAQLIVQCKRQKAAVEKVIVKALYADVLNEQAESGIIVTTSRRSPGAKKPVGRDDTRFWPVTVPRSGHGLPL
jgi:restriction system protein